MIIAGLLLASVQPLPPRTAAPRAWRASFAAAAQPRASRRLRALHEAVRGLRAGTDAPAEAGPSGL